MTGNWEVNVSVAMPQKVASAMGKLSETMLGAEYTPILYLGSQVVNGINHAVLAEQLIITGRDTKNIVVIIFNEKPGDMEVSLVGIERVLESGGQLGGTEIAVKLEIGDEAMRVWDDAFEGFVGSSVTPIALLGTQVVNGTNYVFVVSSKVVSLGAVEKVGLVTINDKTKRVSFTDILTSRHETSLEYAFNW